MFHNSTTLWRLHQNTAFTGRENRPIYAIKDKLEAAGSKIVSGVKKTGSFFKKASWIFGGPILWKGVSLGWKGAKKTANVVGYGGRTTAEAGKGVWGMTTTPLWTLTSSVVQDVRISLLDVSRNILKGIPKLFGAAIGTPGMLVKSARNAFTSVFQGTKNVYESAKTFKLKNIINSTREAAKDLLRSTAEPFTPYKEAVAPTLGSIARSKLQYAYALDQSRKQFTEGFRRIINAPTNAKTQMAQAEVISLEKARQKQAAKAEADEQQQQQLPQQQKLKAA